MPIKNLFNRLFSSGEPAPVPPTAPAPPPEVQVAPPAAHTTPATPPQSTPQDALTTIPLPVATAKPTTSPRSAVTFRVGRATDVGRVRTHNEDALYVFTGEQEGSSAVPPFGLFVLADGMGGHQSGEFASSLACRVVAEQLLGKVYLSILGSFDRDANQPALRDVVSEAVAAANMFVSQTLPGSGTTLTCGMVMGERLLIGHVGDSRAYLLRPDTEPLLLTNDHSLVHRLMEMGQLTAEEAAIHPQRNVLYRAVGQGSALDVDVALHTMHQGDRLLLCSDGLWNMLSEAEVWALIDRAATPQEACDWLVAAANEAGGNDNTTVILVEILRDLA